MSKFGKTIVASMKKRISKIRQDRRGNTVIMFGFMLIPILGFTGLAVDGGRVFMVKSQLSSAVDVTALAAARTFTDPDRDDKAREFFTANFTADLADTELSAVTIKPSTSGTNKIITVSASATVPTLFMRVLGIKNVTVKSEAQAARGEVPIELVMALDNTGSMARDAGGVSRLTALKDASAVLINTIYGDSDTSSKVHIGIIPYTAYVNVGRLPELTGEVSFVTPTPGYTDRPVTDALGWKGCVDADASNPNADGDLSSAAWNTAFDTMDSLPGAQIKASLFPSFQIEVKERETACPSGHWIAKTYTDTQEFILVAQTCNEGECGSKYVPNPNFGKSFTSGYCDAANEPTGNIHTSKWPIHPYNTSGLTSIYGRPNPFPSGLDKGRYFSYVYIPEESTERPPLPYASRSTDRTSESQPPIIYNSATPTSDNFTDVTVSKVEENLPTDPNSAASPNTYCPQQALPLKVHTKTAVLSYVNNELKAFFPDWGTLSNQGLVWSWRMLSPNLPLAGLPNGSGFAKVVVLMTDGALYHYGGSDANNGFGSKYLQRLAAHDGVRTPYGFGSEKTLVNDANATKSQLIEALRNRLNKTCANMRKAGITIYTVTVDTTMTAAQKDDYRNCATKPNMYFDAPDATSLKKAFATIADNLAGVRLVK
jgi:Flp pilus assembly protein TadG